DRVDYSQRAAGVTVTSGSGANDGAPSEGDNVAADVERIDGTQLADSITGGANSETINGTGGNDTLSGGPGGPDVLNAGGGDGNDTISGGTNGVGESDVLTGGIGNDTFAQTASPTPAETISGGAGTDTVDYSGRAAAVVVTVGSGADDGDSATSEADNIQDA